jgi:Pyruvate/2-oxoacid:ferredoxin oxidoreductase gamma subunit
MRIAAFPFTDIAADLGNPKAANTVALGLYIARTRLVKKESVVGVFYRIAPAGKQDLIKLNVIALEKGMSLDD